MSARGLYVRPDEASSAFFRGLSQKPKRATLSARSRSFQTETILVSIFLLTRDFSGRPVPIPAFAGTCFFLTALQSL